MVFTFLGTGIKTLPIILLLLIKVFGNPEYLLKFKSKIMGDNLDVQYLKAIVSGIVRFPEEVKITRRIDEMGVLLSLEVHKEDMGRVIGRSGTTAQAMRTLLRVMGMTNQSRVNLVIVEPPKEATE